MSDEPPMDPDTSESDAQQLRLARVQGDAYLAAVRHMIEEVADSGGMQDVDDYTVGYAIEEAEGMYAWTGGDIEWQDPGDTTTHVEVAVLDRADGRFVPGLTVTVTISDGEGREIATQVQPLLWHPMIYHYGANWKLPRTGDYFLMVHIDPPEFMRHDETNGRRFLAPVDARFGPVPITVEQEG